MAGKSQRGLPDSLKQGFNFRATPEAKPVPEPEAVIEPVSQPETTAIPVSGSSNFSEDKAVITAKSTKSTKTANTIQAAPVATGGSDASSNTTGAATTRKMGRPRGREKVKKTFYLEGGIANIKTAQLALVKKADIFIKDESEVVDLSLEILNRLLKSQEGLDLVLSTYRQLSQDG